MRKIVIVCLLCLFVATVQAQELPIPRYATLKSDLVNMRSGPGERYPIEWVYKRVNMPVEIIDAYEYWYKVKDFENTSGWMHKKMLSQKRYGLTAPNGKTAVYKKEDATSDVTAYFDGSSIVQLLKCSPKSAFCLISYEQLKGYVLKKDIFGVYPNEEID